MDTTTEFLTAFYSQKFSSFEEFHSKLKDFEKLTGSIYIIHSSKFLPQDHADRGRLVYSALQYFCYHYGVCQTPATPRRNQRNPRGSCSSRIFLSAMNGKLWITKYHMIHSHSPLPETTIIDQSVRRLQVQEPGNDEPVISEDVQVVLDDIVDQLPNHNISLSNFRDSPNKFQPGYRPVIERKAAAKDRLAARTKKARGLKLAPCLRRLAELASAGTGQEFHKHMNELEALVDIWKRGDTSSLAVGSGLSNSQQSITPSSTDSLAIAKAVENLFRKQKAAEQRNTILSSGIPARGRGRPPKTSKILTSITGGNAVSAIQSPAAPMVLKQALGSQPTAYLTGQGLLSQGGLNVSVLPSTGVANLPKDVVFADNGNGQLQIINSGTTADGQPLVGYVIQPMTNLSASGQAYVSTPSVGIAPTNFVPIAPKAPVIDSTGQIFHPLPPPPPRPVRPPMPVCKPKIVKPRGRQSKLKTGMGEGYLMASDAPLLTQVDDSDAQDKPWTSMIMEGESCSYFLFIEDANYFYSEEDDAWLPTDQQTMPVDA